MLLVSIHDVAPRHLAAVRALRDAAQNWGADAVTLLAVPDFHGDGPLSESRSTVRWLRNQLAAGDEVALHGYFHRQRRRPADPLQRVRAALFTDREGECLTLTHGEQRHMLACGRAMLEDALDFPVRGFVAPAWLEPPAFDRALWDAGFAWHETATYLERFDDAGPRRVWLPAIGFATRSPARQWASIGWGRALLPYVCRTATAGQPVRVALHPGDAGCEPVMRCAERVVRALVERTRAATVAAWCDADDARDAA